MHGHVLCELRQFLIERYDEDVWDSVLGEAAVDRQLFVPVTDYPDAYYYELVGTAADRSGRDVDALEREFGRFLAGRHLEYSCCSVDDATEYSGLASADDLVSAWFDRAGVETEPFSLDAERTDEHCVRITYGSPQGLCNVVRGIVGGLEAVDEIDWSITETRCMHDGARACTFVVSAATPVSNVMPAGRMEMPEATD